MIIHVAFDFHLIWIPIFFLGLIVVFLCAMVCSMWRDRIDKAGFPYTEVGRRNPTTGRYEIDPAREHRYVTDRLRPIFKPVALIVWNVQKRVLARRWIHWTEYLEAEHERYIEKRNRYYSQGD